MSHTLKALLGSVSYGLMAYNRNLFYYPSQCYVLREETKNLVSLAATTYMQLNVNTQNRISNWTCCSALMQNVPYSHQSVSSRYVKHVYLRLSGQNPAIEIHFSLSFFWVSILQGDIHRLFVHAKAYCFPWDNHQFH